MRYEDLLPKNEYLGPSDTEALAQDVVSEILSLVHRRDAGSAGSLLTSRLHDTPSLVECLCETLVDRLAPPRIGAPTRNTEHYLLRIYDDYRSDRHGRAEDRLARLAVKYNRSVTTMQELLKKGRKLGRQLAADAASDLAEQPIFEVPEIEPHEDWAAWLSANAIRKKSQD